MAPVVSEERLLARTACSRDTVRAKVIVSSIWERSIPLCHEKSLHPVFTAKADRL